MTQEQLAELLNISPQAVSRWENNAAMPDISLLPPLANLFDVTTDYLLGMDTWQKDLRREEYDKAFFEYWKREDKEKNYQIALKATAEYPGDMAYLEWLASSEYYVAFLQADDTGYHDLLDNAIKHYDTVIRNSIDEKLRTRARHGIVLALHYAGRIAEAKTYAMSEENERERDELLVWGLEGEEKKRHCQKLAEQKLSEFLFQLTLTAGENSLEAYDAVEKILEILFPDGNYLFYHNTLQYNAIKKAFCLCKMKKYDDALVQLKKARYHAEEMTKFGRESSYHFTNPLFCLLEGEKHVSDASQTDLDDFFLSLENQCYDPIRDREEFRQLAAK